MATISSLRKMKPAFIQEKNRIFILKCKTQETASQKLFIVNLFAQNEKTDKMIECENYYAALDKHLQNKIDFWDGCIRGEIPENFLSKFQEDMTEWLETGWAYLGQENIEKESEEAKVEFALVKQICSIFKKKK